MGAVRIEKQFGKQLRQTSLQHLSSFQPRPKRGRRRKVNSAATPQQQKPDNFRAVAATDITAASGITSGNITPGVGTAYLYVEPVNTSPAGTPWARGEIVQVENWMQAVIKAKKPLLLRMSRTNDNTGITIYEAIAEGCKAVPDSLGGTG